jgi:hypothetical protein
MTSSIRPVWENLSPPTHRLKRGTRMETPSQESTDLRVELVARIRREIHAGTYDSAAKLEAALEQLLARLACD